MVHTPAGVPCKTSQATVAVMAKAGSRDSFMLTQVAPRRCCTASDPTLPGTVLQDFGDDQRCAECGPTAKT